MKYYKFLKKGLKSAFDNSSWKIGEWRTVRPPQEECKGLNASEKIIDAMKYVQKDILAEVEFAGEVIAGTDKITAEKMRILRAWKWEQKHWVMLAVFAAESCLKKYEKEYPNDLRPRQAIKATKAWLENPTQGAADSAKAAADSAFEKYIHDKILPILEEVTE